MIIGALSRASAERAPTFARGGAIAVLRVAVAGLGCGAHVGALCAALAVYSRSALIVSAIFFSSAESSPLPSSSVDVNSVLPSAKPFF